MHSVPVVILDKRVVTTQVDAHLMAVHGVVGNHCRRDAQVLVGVAKHLHYLLFIVIKMLVLAGGILKIAVVALSIENTVGIEASFQELAVNIRCYDEIVLAADKSQQCFIKRRGSSAVTGKPNVLGPISPSLRLGLERIE